MKKILLSSISCLLVFLSMAQKGKFDLASYTAPAGWKKATSESAVQFTKEDAATGAYCMITLFKAIPGGPEAKENFDMAWSSVVKEMVTVSQSPEMQTPASENGWMIHSGYAPFENDGNKGIALLVTSTGYEKMVNLVVLTNTDVYEKELSAFLASIDLAKPAVNTNKVNLGKIGATPPSQKTQAIQTGFAFSTTNFDDGWTSTVQEDWVEVTKAGIKVLIHYPNKKADEYNSDLMAGLKNAWNVLVAPKYSSASNFEFKPLSGWESIEFAEADMIEKNTGRSVHVVLFKKNFSGGNGKYLEFITSDKRAFEQQFGAYQKESSGSGWDKMINMATYNKFAVAASDLKGKWTSNFTGLTQYVNAYTGASAGANTHASNENFEFGAANTYKWDIGVASGFVGNIKFQSAKSSGQFKMLNNWQVNFSDMEGKPKTYNVQFTCIKGSRVLWIGETAFGKKQ